MLGFKVAHTKRVCFFSIGEFLGLFIYNNQSSLTCGCSPFLISTVCHDIDIKSYLFSEDSSISFSGTGAVCTLQLDEASQDIVGPVEHLNFYL